MHIDAATAGFLGTISGGIIGLAGNLIIKVFDERKERRQLMVKAAWDYWAKGFDAAQLRNAQTAPFEAFMFHALKVIELWERRDLSDEQLRDELKKAREFMDTITVDAQTNRRP